MESSNFGARGSEFSRFGSVLSSIQSGILKNIQANDSLLQKDEKFVWTPECDEAFHKLRTLLTSAPVLAQPDIEKPFDVFCDALGIGLGYVLMQEGRVIAYASCQLRKHEVNVDGP